MKQLPLILALLAAACAFDSKPAQPTHERGQKTGVATIASQDEPVSFVDPFIGTGGHGHTFPGATRPFGMVQVSPDTRLTGWDGGSGYHDSDREIYGFSHTHVSG
jgi:putative alpha-1,2-mannosidase